MRQFTDEQLRQLGASESLLLLRRGLNEQIAEGRNWVFCQHRRKLVQVKLAYIASTGRHATVLLQTTDNQIVEHFSELVFPREAAG